MIRWLRRWGRWLLFAAGAAALVFLIRDAGTDAVLATLARAAPWMGFILALEIGWGLCDALAYRESLGEAKHHVPLALWWRSSVTAYAVMMLLPAGRAGAEATRAAILMEHLGPRSIAAAARFQATVLIANGLVSLPCAIAVGLEMGASSPLTWLVIGNGVGTSLLGFVILQVARHSRIGESLARRFPALQRLSGGLDDALREGAVLPLRALSLAFTGRLVQTMQYGLLLLAVGGTLTFQSAWIAESIHLVGAGLGDLVPNAVGVTEGAYRLFAPALGLQDEPARAIGIALVARLGQVVLSLLALVFGGRRPRI
jgi:hypothetical protein